MKPWNHPGKKHARRARAEARTAGAQYYEGHMIPTDTRFRVGRAHRDERGQIVGVPAGFPKVGRDGPHPSVRIHHRPWTQKPKPSVPEGYRLLSHGDRYEPGDLLWSWVDGVSRETGKLGWKPLSRAGVVDDYHMPVATRRTQSGGGT